MALYVDIYKIIIDLLPYEIYPSLRLVCSEWFQYIEITDFQKVIQLIRTINSPPCYSIDRVDYICYVDGTFNINDHWYRYMNGSIIDCQSMECQKIQEINNNYGKFELYYNKRTTYVKINGLISSPISLLTYHLPRFIRADYEVHVIIGHQYYKYENNQLTCISYEIKNGNIYDSYITYNFNYVRDHDKISIFKDDKKVGVVTMRETSGFNFGIGHDYCIVKKADKTYFWDFHMEVYLKYVL